MSKHRGETSPLVVFAALCAVLCAVLFVLAALVAGGTSARRLPAPAPSGQVFIDAATIDTQPATTGCLFQLPPWAPEDATWRAGYAAGRLAAYGTEYAELAVDPPGVTYQISLGAFPGGDVPCDEPFRADRGECRVVRWQR